MPDKVKLYIESNLSKELVYFQKKYAYKIEILEKLINDKSSLEIFLIIFPDLKNIDFLKKIDSNKKEIFKNADFIFLLSLMIIDETDNSDFFLYKFNMSNQDKLRINSIKEIYNKFNDKNTFSKKNLQKIFYYQGKNYLIDALDFKLFLSNKKNSKLLELKKYFENLEIPKFPIKAKIIMEKYNLKEGKELGQKLKSLENLWVENSFSISEKEVENTFLN